MTIRSRSMRGSRNADRLDLRAHSRGELVQRHDIDSTPQQRLEVVREVEERGQDDRTWIELNDEIDVAGPFRLASRHRAEQLKVSNPIRRRDPPPVRAEGRKNRVADGLGVGGRLWPAELMPLYRR